VNDFQSFIHSKKNLNVMKQQAKMKKEKQANCFKQLEKAYEKEFFKAEKRKGEFSMLDKMEDDFWVAVETRKINVKLPNSDFQRKAVFPFIDEQVNRGVFA
jgi:uncharacterized Fe-S cluster-containing protein